MNHTIYILSALILIAIPSSAWGQFDSLKNSIQGRAYISTLNAAFLNEIESGTLSYAGLASSFGYGNFCNYNQSNKDYTATADAESYFRFNNETSGYGKICYQNITNYNTNGSAFFNPNNTPFDIVEQDNNAGTSTSEICNITGALGSRIFRNISGGLKADYIVGNTAKRKDLRHKNNIMDLSISCGFSYNTDFMRIGSNYVYQRRNETVKFSTQGVSSQTYNCIIGYAAFWGIREEFGSEGFTNKSRNMPLSDQYHGLDAQILLKPTNNIKAFLEYSYRTRNGKYGHKSQYTEELTNHDGFLNTLRSICVYKYGISSHIIDVELSENRLSCFKNISMEEVLEGGLVTFVYYGQQKISQHNTRIINAEYSTIQPTSSKSDIKFNIGINFVNRQQLATRYPYYRQQNLVTKKIYAQIHHTTHLHDTKELTASMMLMMQKGYGRPYTDGQIAPSNGLLPSSNNTLLMQEYEFMCKPHVSINAAMQYKFPIIANSLISISASYTYNHAKNTFFVGPYHHNIKIKIGYEF